MTSLSRKYAVAFTRYYHWYKQDFTWMEKLDRVTNFLLMYRHHFVYEPRQKYSLVFKNFEIRDFDFNSIMTMLEKQHRTLLFPDILYEIVQIYKMHHGIESCSVTMTYELTPEQKNIFEDILEKKRGKKLLYSYAIDHSLIAGIRARGESFIYEDTIKQRLKAIGSATKMGF